MLDVRNVYLTVFLQKKTGRMEQHWQKVRKRIYWEMVTDTKTFLFVFIVSMIARARYELLDKFHSEHPVVLLYFIDFCH
jgi:hypothetical protein